jgi:hypothetical protein
MSNEKTRLDITALAFILALFLVPPVLAKKPLIGTMDLSWNPAWYPGAKELVPDWVGTVTIDGDDYYMEFYNLETSVSNPGKDGHFDEIWWIKESATGPTVLKGTDSGVVSVANSKYRMNGVVTETNNDFAEWLGRQVHMNGVIIWASPGVPSEAPGEFRIN